MRRTTEQWEALLDGTTPGPWEYQEHEYCPYADMEDRAAIHGGPMPEIPYPCGCEEDDTCEVQRYVVGNEDGVWAHNPPFWEARPADMKAVAHFPEAVAEVIRLRREVAAFRDQKHALSKVQYQTARDLKNGIFDETFGTMPETHTVEAWEMGARTNQRTVTALTRILEGEV